MSAANPTANNASKPARRGRPGRPRRAPNAEAPAPNAGEPAPNAEEPMVRPESPERAEVEAQVPDPERVVQQPRIDVEAEAEDDPVSPEPEQVDRALEDPEMEERTTDLEASLDFKVDKSFDEPEWDAYLPPSAKIVEGFNSLKIPQINTDQKPTPMTILQFVYDMMGYRRMDPAVKKPVMAKAFQGRDAER